MTQVQAVKSNKGILITTSLVALLFAYIVTKDVSLPLIVLYGGFAAGTVVLLFKGVSNPAVVTYALVAYLPFSRILVGDFGGMATALNLTNILMLFIIFVWLTGRYAEGEPMWLSTPLNFPIILFMFIGGIAIFRAQYMGEEYVFHIIIEYKRWITPFFLYFLVLNTVKEKETIKNIIYVMMIVTAIVGLMAIYEYMDVGTGSSLDRSRIGGIADQPNMLAAFFNYYMFLPFGFFLMNMNRWRYWGLLLPFLICFRGIMVTFSRGGYLAFACGLYAITFFRSRLLFFLLLLATFIVFLNPVLLPAGIRYRMGQTFQADVSYVDSMEGLEDSLESSAHSRVEVWKGGLKMIQDRPVFGVGYGLFQPMIRYYWSGGTPIDAHNTYLIIAAEMGIPALLIFLWILGLVFWQTYGLYRTTHDPFAKALALGFLGGLFGLLMSNMFGSRLDSQEVSSYFWILAALVMRLRILDQKERKRGNAPASPERAAVASVPKLDACWNA